MTKPGNKKNYWGGRNAICYMNNKTVYQRRCATSEKVQNSAIELCLKQTNLSDVLQSSSCWMKPEKPNQITNNFSLQISVTSLWTFSIILGHVVNFISDVFSQLQRNIFFTLSFMFMETSFHGSELLLHTVSYEHKHILKYMKLRFVSFCARSLCIDNKEHTYWKRQY